MPCNSNARSKQIEPPRIRTHQMQATVEASIPNTIEEFQKLNRAFSTKTGDITKRRRRYRTRVLLRFGTCNRGPGQIQKLSKREGNIFELNLLIEEIGIDNFRYFMCYRKNDTHMDLDIDLIKKENKENPIYYIQYSYARSQSVLDRKKNIITSNVDFSKELKNLYKRLYDWDYVVLNAYNKNEVHLIAHYLESLASFFHTFWSSSKDNPSMRFLDQDNNI